MGTQATVGRVRRGALIGIMAAVVLVASPWLGVASAGGRADAGRASSIRGGRLAHVAFLAPLASFVVQELASNAFSTGFGWVLGQFGEGDSLAPQIDQIQSKLQTIDDRLSAIESTTSQLRGELALGTFSVLVRETDRLIGQIDYAMGELNYIADRTGNDSATKAERKRKTEALQSYIGIHLLDKQGELNRAVQPKFGDGLIVAAYKAAKTNTRFWTALTSSRVRSVLDYYQDEQARLLLLRVEYWHLTGESGHYIATKIKEVEDELKAQQSLLKPEPQRNVIADTHTNQDWFLSGLFWQLTRSEARIAAANVEDGGFVGKQYLARGWKFASQEQVLKLIEGWHGKDWVDWLNSKIDNQLTVPCCFVGVWSPHGLDTAFAVRANGKGAWFGTAPSLKLGMLFVRTRSAEYWY